MGRRRSRPPSPRLTLRRFAWGLVATALLLGGPAAVSGAGSAFLWIDIGGCVVLATLLFLVASGERRPTSRRSAPRGRGRGDRYRWRNTALVASALITILSPVVKLLVDIATQPVRTVTVRERACPRPQSPGEDDPPY